MSLLIYLLLGSIVGVLAGLLGVGGGLVIVPVLAGTFAIAGFPAETIMHFAVGTSLATIVPTSLSSVRAHHKKAAVLWPWFRSLTPGIVIGALLGALVADQIPSDQLKIFFGLFELIVAVQLFWGIKPHATGEHHGPIGKSIAGTGIGLVSAVVGIGGGTMTVPYLLWNKVSTQKAVATSSACGLPIAVAGAAGFVLTGWDASGPDYSSGYIYWPAFVVISITSVVFAPLGAHWAHKIDGVKLKKGFALFLFVIGLRMLLS
ncbi:MAG: sulfite exporter TauE/SafE family protein [Gammaproteobacteria bacterium]|nr:sulfite exporter TauE/SafE family protein [Gammaproteobacteria bacterium]